MPNKGGWFEERILARIDFQSQRLFVEVGLSQGATVSLDRAQANYLLNVLRFKPGDALLVFNGRDGEWRADLAEVGRKAASLRVVEQTRPQPAASPITSCFAPLKHARLDYMVQKAVEMGAGVLQPVLTQHTQASRLNHERMRANSIEAAEQCGVLALPEIRPEVKFERWLAERGNGLLVFCDEDAASTDALGLLSAMRRSGPYRVDVLIGPEGGFSAGEREALLAQPRVVRLPLGPRILRADTAAVAALALVQASLGDWRPSAAGKALEDGHAARHGDERA